MRLRRNRPLQVCLALLVAGLLTGCGDDDEETTVTDTVTAPAETTSVEEPSGETADLPLCSEADVRPCRTEEGAVLEEGGANGGEIADLPLCSEAPPPCREASGELVEP